MGKLGKSDKTVRIPISQLKPNPDNPRKDLGDLTELTESIKKNGVMQNLTVMPDTDGKYLVLIGHRRMAAAQAAGLDELECRIVDEMPRNKQISIMLTENIQRNDLTVLEQAESFQLMLDLGDNVETIAEKSGFSQSTVRHRLEIAKLNKTQLKKMIDDEDGWQISIKDLEKLEGIKSLSERNRILKESTDSANLAWKIQCVKNEEIKEKNLKALKKLLDDAGIREMTEKESREAYGYDSQWEEVKEYDLEKDAPETLRIGKLKDGKIDGKEAAWRCPYGRTLQVYKKVGKKERTLSKWEIEQKEREGRKKKLDKVMKAVQKQRENFIDGIMNRAIDMPDDKDLREIFDLAMETDVTLSNYQFMHQILQLETWNMEDEEKELHIKNIKQLTMAAVLLAFIVKGMSTESIADYNMAYKAANAEDFRKVDELLGRYGFSPEVEGYADILNGASDLYTKGE